MDYSQFIKVYVVLEKEVVRLAIDKDTRAEDVTIELCHKLGIRPVARHLFSLRFYNNKEWVSPLVKLIDSKATLFELRLRFKVPDFSKLKAVDISAYNYYFHQVRNDVLNNKVSDISYEKYKKELLGMGVADMYRVMLESGLSRDNVEGDYKKYIPKEVLKHHLFFVKKPIHDTLDSIQKGCRQGKHDALYVKNVYLKQFEALAPNYLCEEFKAAIDEAGSIRAIVIHVNPYDKELPGISYSYEGKKEICNINWGLASRMMLFIYNKNHVKMHSTTDSTVFLVFIFKNDCFFNEMRNHICSVEDLCFITVRSDSTIEIARKTGIPTYLKFYSILSMFSLVSLLDGYYRLGVKWTFSLCKDLPTPSLERLYTIKCHGPIGGEFSYSKLEKMRSSKPGCYILRESEIAYNQYYLDVCTAHSTKPTTYKIEKSLECDYIFNGETTKFQTIEQLLVDLRTSNGSVQLLECLPPSEYDISPLLLCRLDENSYLALDDDKLPLALPSSPQCINTKELQVFKGKKKEFKGSMTTVYRGVWRRKGQRKVDIALKVYKPETRENYVDELLEMMGYWASVQSPAIVRLFGVTLNRPLGMVMEYLPLGPLDIYLKQNGSILKEVDLVEAANYLATALWNLEESGVIHGNIRCHKLLVAAHTETSFVVRLSDPGLFHTYADNDMHWLAPEFYSLVNNVRVSQAADVWAFGTTLWEIFSKGQTPAVSESDLKKYYLSGKRLPCPAGCSVDIYSLMLQCWNPDPQHRKKMQEAMRDINHLLYQVFNSRRIHSYATAMPKQHKHNTEMTVDTLSISLSTDQTTISSDLTMNLSSSSQQNMGDMVNQCSWGESAWLLATSQELSQQRGLNSPDVSTMLSHIDFSTATTSLDSVTSLQGIFELEGDCNVVLQGRIGQGFYGEVYKGCLEQLDKDVEPQLVAVKKLKTDCISANLHDFEREISIMKRLQHENIVQIKGVIQEPEVSLVMEYVPHGSLQCYLKINSDRLKPENLLKFAFDVAKGMEYLGEKKIVHRDLATRNILVASENHVKISDFGLAQVMGSNNYYILKTSRELPIKWYAPESLRDGKFSTRSDVWSYGVTLFEMFSLGEDPQLPALVEKSTDQALLLAALDSGSRLPCPAQCPQNIYVRLISPCWSQESHSRPTFKTICHTIADLQTECYPLQSS